MSNLGFTAFLVDDDQGVLKALTRLLRAAGYNTESFCSPREFLTAHDASVPGCAIVDLAMSELDGLQLQEILINDGSERPIIFLTGYGDISSSVKAMRAGAIDFLTKPVKHELLFAALDRAAEVDRQLREKRQEERSINDRLAMLTRREREVLRYVVAGRLNKQIAATLGTVEKTIKVHRGRMMTKLGVRCVADLVRLTERAGIPPEREAP